MTFGEKKNISTNDLYYDEFITKQIIVMPKSLSVVVQEQIEPPKQETKKYTVTIDKNK